MCYQEIVLARLRGQSLQRLTQHSQTGTGIKNDTVTFCFDFNTGCITAISQHVSMSDRV
jgi:hypothetical protein